MQGCAEGSSARRAVAAGSALGAEQPPVTPTLSSWAACEAHTVPGNEQNCKSEGRRTTAPLGFGGIGCILFFPRQSELSLESSCAIAAFIILPFLSQSGVYLPSKCRYSSKYT